MIALDSYTDRPAGFARVEGGRARPGLVVFNGCGGRFVVAKFRLTATSDAADRPTVNTNADVLELPSFFVTELTLTRGSAHTFSNGPDAAIADYTKALELRPRDVDTLFLRGSILAAVERWDAALPDFTAVIGLDRGTRWRITTAVWRIRTPAMSIGRWPTTRKPRNSIPPIRPRS